MRLSWFVLSALTMAAAGLVAVTQSPVSAAPVTYYLSLGDSLSQGHMPGAINVPFDFLPDHAEAWKKEKRLLVTYCACVNEGTAARAALDMNAFGISNVKALLGGWNDWVKRGEKIER